MNPIETALHDNTRWEEVHILNRSFLIQRIHHIDLLLEALSDEEFNQDERLPYWAEIWPASVALASYAIEHQSEFEGKKILELGCGLGLVGIAVHAVGGDVLFTDNDIHALRFTQINFRRNFNQPASVQLFDWRNPGNLTPVDIILGADILYEKRWLQPVLDIIELKLKPQGFAYIAGPDRAVSRGIYDMIEKRKWKRQSLLKRISIDDKLHQIIIDRISKC
jgi:predicted nicotinamide N-methyase